MLQVNREFDTADSDVQEAAMTKLKEICKFTDEIASDSSEKPVETAPAGQADELESGALNLC